MAESRDIAKALRNLARVIESSGPADLVAAIRVDGSIIPMWASSNHDGLALLGLTDRLKQQIGWEASTICEDRLVKPVHKPRRKR